MNSDTLPRKAKDNGQTFQSLPVQGQPRGGGLGNKTKVTTFSIYTSEIMRFSTWLCGFEGTRLLGNRKVVSRQCSE